MGIFDKFKSSNTTAEFSWPAVDPMGNPVGYQQDELETEKDRKLKIATENRREAELARNESDAETRRLLRQNEQAQATAHAAEDKKIAEEKKAESQNVNQKVNAPPRDNPLFAYADYTYGLSLHIIPPDIFNKIASDPNYVYVPRDKNNQGTVLIASAGRREKINFERHPEFKEDFYFDSLKFNTVVGMNARNKNANTLDISFTLIEPYGITLINRLLKSAGRLQCHSWMQLPFMLQIDFFGNNQLGEILHPIPNQTKYIPVRMIGCKVKVSSKGAEYQVSCVPFNHQAFQESVATTPAFFDVKAKTVNDFFSATGSAGDIEKYSQVQKVKKERREALMEEIRQEEDSDPNGQRKADLTKKVQELDQDVSKISYRVGSYTAAMNSFQNQLKTANYQNPDSYEFKFHPDIGNSDIVIPEKTDVRRTPMNSPNTKEAIAAIRAQAGLPTAGLDRSTEVFSINAGTSVIDVINMVMRNSKYIRDQISDPAVDGQQSADKANKPIKWYKIVPKVELREFDSKRQMYAKHITYHVEPYTYYNNKFKDAPQSFPDSHAKLYNYMYTGKNQSIISFDIDFDIMFYTAITANRSNLQAAALQTEQQGDKTDDSKQTPTEPKVQDKMTKYHAGSLNVQNPQSPDSKGVLVNDLNKSMLSGSRGDMINVKLKIIGDPEFIKQDDIYYNPTNNPDQRSVNHIDPKTNSIIFDAGEVFAKLIFRTPTDFNPESGLMKFDQVETSVFSGVYKVIMVENEFSHGQFTQSLTLVRLFDQPIYDTLSGEGIGKAKSQEVRAKQATSIAESKAPDEQVAAYDQKTEATTTPTEPADTSDTETNPTPATAQIDFDDGQPSVTAQQQALREDLEDEPVVGVGEGGFA